LNNVQGYIKYAKYIWGESVSEPPPPPPPELEPIEEEAVEDALIEEPPTEDGLVEKQPLDDALVDNDTLEEIEELVEEKLPDK
jgi:hypothetical protein